MAEAQAFLECSGPDTNFRTINSTDEFCIQAVPLTDVKMLDKERFNNNNCWQGGLPPADYSQVLNRGNTSLWIDQFKRQYVVINIDARDRAWMRKAAVIGYKTGRFSNMFKDELDALLMRHKETDTLFAQGTPYFVRTETVSLKNGCHGIGPYFDLRSIIESMVTSTEGHSPLDERLEYQDGTDMNNSPQATRTLKLYLIPWQQITTDREFRVFVHNDRVTAVSQQHLYRTNELLASQGSDDKRVQLITSWLQQIITYHSDILCKKLPDMHSYCMDLAILDDGTLFFIEPNCFGAEYAAGSSLYHWIHDKVMLYGTTTTRVFFRYTE